MKCMTICINNKFSDAEFIQLVTLCFMISMPHGNVWDNRWQVRIHINGFNHVDMAQVWKIKVKCFLMFNDIFWIYSIKKFIISKLHFYLFESICIMISNLWVATKNLLIASVMATYLETKNRHAAEWGLIKNQDYSKTISAINALTKITLVLKKMIHKQN